MLEVWSLKGMEEGEGADGEEDNGTHPRRSSLQMPKRR